MAALKGLTKDESVPAHPDGAPGHPLVVFGDHSFCAGSTEQVNRMAFPHMHSQIELNFVLEGRMTYWFDGRELAVDEGRLVLFWGMIPHQVREITDPTRFVCLYAPMSVFLSLPSLSRIREAVFRGAMIEALDIRPYDRDILLQWRKELLGGDEQLSEIVKDELTARIRRLDHEGWRDLREEGSAIPAGDHHDADRVVHVERMIRYISENALSEISVADVAGVTPLHANYAMTLFKRSVGMSIGQAIVRHRLDTAQSLLISTDLPVTSIAYEAGFGSLSRFYEAFYQRFHTKPGAFRKRIARNTGQIT